MKLDFIHNDIEVIYTTCLTWNGIGFFGKQHGIGI